MSRDVTTTGRTWSYKENAQALRDTRAALEENGYALLPGVLDGQELGELRHLTDRVAARERDDKTAWYSNGNQRIFNLVNRGRAYVDLIEHPAALHWAELTLGPDVLLSSITANIAAPGNVPQLLHTDQQYVTEPWMYMVTLNVVWLLDDFTAENGGTRMVPRSHLLTRGPVTENIETVPLTGPAGSIALIDGRVWHGTGANTTENEYRRALFAYYCAPFLRQQENVFRSLSSEARRQLSARARKLLGFDVWKGVGVVDGIPREWMGIGRRSGPVNSDGFFPAD
ncbi:phytanoyl-CoA dioxygenase family protein [Streptomyces sp. SS8]